LVVVAVAVAVAVVEEIDSGPAVANCFASAEAVEEETT